jgi:hypothetical protein
MNKLVVKISIGVILIVLLVILSMVCYQERKDNIRLSNNQIALLSDVGHYRSISGKNAASVQRLALTKSELENNCKSLSDKIKDLNIKLKRVQSVSSSATVSDYEIRTLVKDSIIFQDKIKYITVRTIRYNDPWMSMSGVIDSSQFVGNIQTRDTLIQVVHRIPRKFLFFKWGCKAIQQEISTSNPHSNITFTKYIEVN